MNIVSSMVRSAWLWVIVSCGFAAGSLQGQFVAFNDHAPGTGTSSNATTWNIFGSSPGAKGALKNITSGLVLPVNVAITTNGAISNGDTAAAPNAGTPLYNTFNGYVDFKASGRTDAVALVPTNASVVYTFSGLNPAKAYSFKGGVVRGGVGGSFPQRWTQFEIVGATSWVNAHTAGCLTNGLNTNAVAINSGVNLVGDMVDWERIVVNQGGSFSVRSIQYTNTIPGGGTANGPYGYALNGFRLEEMVVGPPAVSSVTSTANVVKVVYSIAVDPTSATNVANYSLQGTYGNPSILKASFGSDSKTIQLTTADQIPFAIYTLKAANVADAATGTNVLKSTQLNYTNIGFTTGYIKTEFYQNITGSTIASLTNNSKFPNSPTRVTYYTNDGYWSDSSLNINYGARMSGYFIPQESGQFYFVAYGGAGGSSAVSMSVSTNDNPALKTLILTNSGSLSSALTLNQNQKCYFEVLFKEGATAYDYLYVEAQTPTQGWELLPAAECGNYVNATGGSVSFLQNPVDTGIYIGKSAVLTALATCTSTIIGSPNYQWQCNGTNIPGATSATYITPRLDLTNSGNIYRVLAYVPGAVRVSNPAKVTVTRDTDPPTIVQAFNFGVDRVQLYFSEMVMPASAINIANYVFTNGLAVLNASIDASNTTVTLLTQPMVAGSNYTLVVNGVTDQAADLNFIATNTTVSFTAVSPSASDIGMTTKSVTTVLSNGVSVTALGTDIGSGGDQLNFNWQLCSGDFDLRVRLGRMSPSDVWAKAGLMARESLTANSRFVASLATPAMNGCLFMWRDTPGAATSTGGLGTVPANYPDTWLRLLRFGNNYAGFASYDGTNWTLLGSDYFKMSNTVYVGFATCSHNASTPATVTFLDYGVVGSEAQYATVDIPHDEMGPSSRRTPIAFSEIMYKPAPRADSNNLEFIEIYNSNPYFHDISGYQISANSLSYTFPPNTLIPGGGYIVIAASPSSIQTVYGVTNVMGPYTGSLKKSDVLQLIDENGAVLLNVPYSSFYPWPVAADGTGHSLVLANPTYGEADPRAWDISDAVGGSPGMMDAFRPDPRRNVVINEVLANTTDPSRPDFVELYNHGALDVDLSSCILTDDPTLSRFVIPQGTKIVAGGFISFDRTQLGFGLSAAGETVYLFNPDKSRVLDAVQFEAQANGVSFGRWPNGANAFYPLATVTPGAPNSGILVRDIVINELMYKPISGNDDDQYIELYNKGTNTVSLANWQFTSGVTFTFPPNASLAPDSYLVIARNQTNLFARYSNLSTANTLGDYGGKLPHGGGRVALAMPQPDVVTNAQGVVTNTIYVVEDEVTFGTGGHWGQWSSGGGSSLELIDPRSNHRIADNWADSDETKKSVWTNIETTGVMDNGANYGGGSTVANAQMGLLDVGECLVDNIEVHIAGSQANNVLNSDFESGLGNWTLDGCMSRSSWENSGYSSGHSLHLRCSDRIWTGVNSCQATLTPFSVGNRQSATLRFKARWLHGWPEVLMRLNGNWLEATGPMPVPTNLGTPGARNSRYVSNAGPAIYEVTHFPTVPDYSDNVIVTARVHDPDGVKKVTLNYRSDYDTVYSQAAMNDAGTNGDLIAGDGIYTANLPAVSQLVAFFVSAADNAGTTNRFPELVDNNGPVRECLVRFGDTKPGGSFGVYHYWISDASAQQWSSMPNLSNEYHDGTLVSGKRVIYNMLGRYAGSPYHQQYYRPDYDVCHYKWDFPADDKFHGVTAYNKMHAPGNGPGDDYMLQREQVANTFLRALRVPWISRRFVAVYVNGYRNVPLMEDAAAPSGDMIDQYFPNDNNGFLWKMQPWFEFAASPSGTSVGFDNKSWCSIMPITTTGGAKKTAAYRYMFLGRRTPDSFNNYTNLFSLVDAANSYRYAEYVKDVENIADMENFMRVFAANHAAGNWDSYGANNGQNLYGYIGTQGTKYSLMMYDFNIVLGNSGSWAPGENLFSVNSADANTTRFMTTPEFRRMYWRALQELVNGPLNTRNSGPLMDAKYSVFSADKLGVQDPSSMKDWISQAQSSISAQLGAENPGSFSYNSMPYASDNQLILSGTAPVNIKTILINGVEYPVTWTSVGSWRIMVPLKMGVNNLNIQGVDMKGRAVTGASGSISYELDEVVPPPAGQIVISEIMYKPTVPGAQYVEIYNASTNFAYDMSGWTIKELDYTFPAGSIIKPNATFVLAQDQLAFSAAYGGRFLVSGIFDTPMPETGGILTLAQSIGGPRDGGVIAKVRYENTAPWPVAASGTGSSLQLIDPTRPNWRIYNWSATFPPASLSPEQVNPTLGTVTPLPELWLNEAQPENLSGITNSAGQTAGWIELYNPTTNAVALDSVYLANNYTNLAQWGFPAGMAIQPGEFKLIFTDGRTDLSTSNELHASFTLKPGNGSVALSAQNPLIDSLAPPIMVDYFNYTNIAANHSYGSYPDGQVFTRKEFFYATPGASNNPSGTALPVAINEFMAGNTHTVANPISGKYDDWFELYNYSDSAVDLSGCYLTHTVGNPTEFQIPSGYSIPPKGFLMVWADKKSTNGTRELHVNFKLSKSGSSIGLYATNGALVDFVGFGVQVSDVSQGRFPDGGPDIYTMTVPTPAARNIWINTPPSLGPATNWIVTQGQALSFTVHATDPDVPPQFLTYSLGAGAPSDAVIDPYAGTFMWRPTEVGTNALTIVVNDSGVPSLSATQLVVVTVLPAPQLDRVTVTPDASWVVVTWQTRVGQAYQLEYKDDLSWTTWQPVGQRFVGTGDVRTLGMSASSSGQRYYRLRLVP